MVDKTCDVVLNLKLIMPSGLVLIAWVNLSAVISTKCAETEVLIINHTKFAVYTIVLSMYSYEVYKSLERLPQN